MIADTSFVIDLIRNNPAAVRKINELSGEEQKITSPTVFELYTGVSRSKWPEKEKKKVLEYLSRQTIIEMDAKSAEFAGTIDGDLIRKGERISQVDCMIAGIALCKKETVLTKNVKDFSKIKTLSLESY